MNTDEINRYAKQIYAQNVKRGWWDDPNRCKYQTLQLVITEIAEATEGDRKNLNDTHLPHRKMVEVEMADTFIRLLDLAGRYGWIYFEDTGPHRMLRAGDSLAARHFAIVCAVADLGMTVGTASSRTAGDTAYSRAVATILAVCRDESYDLRNAMLEKLEYNKTRHDHSRESRACFDGKRY